MSTIPAVYQIQYGLYVFPVETATLGFDVRPVPDAAGRTNTGNKYAVRLRSYIADVSQGQMDAKLAFARRELTTYGQNFTYMPNSIGGININVSGGRRDLAWGPIPRLLSMKPVGGQFCWEFTWEVEFQTTDCNASYFAFAVKEFNYTVEFEMQGKLRLTSRRYAGHLVIPQTRVGGSRRLTDTADRYFEKVVPPVPFGFRREGESRKLSEDKCRLDFSFSDTMLPTALPVGCVDCEVDRFRSNSKPGVFNVWQGITTARYTVALNWPMQIAQRHFFDLITQELAEVQQSILGGVIAAGLGGAQGGMVVPLTVSFRENVAAREVDCNLAFAVTSSIAGFMTAGMWKPLAVNATHQRWAKSLSLHNRPRGWSQEVVNPSEDVVIDLCLIAATTSPPRLTPAPPPPPPQGERSMRTKCPPEELSFLNMVIEVEEEDESGVVIHKPLPKSVSGTGSPVLNPSGVPAGLADPAYRAQPGRPADPTRIENPPDIAQQVTTPTLYVSLVGEGVKVCYPGKRPELKEYKGQKVQTANRPGKEYFTQKISGNAGVPIYSFSFRQRWRVLRNPPERSMRTREIPDNPLIPKTEQSMRTVDGPPTVQLPNPGDLN